MHWDKGDQLYQLKSQNIEIRYRNGPKSYSPLAGEKETMNLLHKYLTKFLYVSSQHLEPLVILEYHLKKLNDSKIVKRCCCLGGDWEETESNCIDPLR